MRAHSRTSTRADRERPSPVTDTSPDVVHDIDTNSDEEIAAEPTPRGWLIGASLIFLLGSILQRPGEIVYLTRLDRVMDPIRMASRSFSLWNPFWDMGSIQYQTSGYWIPFDLFFISGELLGLPTWLTERLFIAALFVLAFWGLVRLLDSMSIGDRVSRLLAGLAYGMSGVLLGRIGQQTVFAMGAVFLPWALLPLVRGAQRGSTRTAAARSGVAIALMGGANAAVTFAVAPIPLLYLLTRSRGPRRASLIRWWIPCAIAAVLWWFVSLYFLAKYGPDILRYTETSITTTRTTTLFEVLRGTADWFGRLTVTGVALPSGNMLATRAIPIIGLSVVAGLGLFGLAHRRMPERRFFILVLLLGAMAVGGGYIGIFGNPLAGQYRGVLDGALGAFRNVYKFQPLVTLPIAVGVAHGLSVLTASIRSRLGSGFGRLVPAAALLVVFACAMPVWRNVLTKGPGFESVPTAWVDAGKWLEDNAQGRVLVAPGLAEADYDWGFLQQIPLQWGSDITWATRNQAPIGGPRTIEYLDAVERAIDRGGDPELAAFLQRGGFSDIVVPTDYSPIKYRAPDPESVVFALSRSGLTPIASFGDTGYGFGGLHQLEVFSVPGAKVATTYSAASSAWLSGDVGSVMDLPSSQFGDRAYVLPADEVKPPYSPSNWVVTDGNKSQGYEFGSSRSNRNYVAGPEETTLNGVSLRKKRLYDRDRVHETTQVLSGVRSITASSVGPGIFVSGRSSREPANVFDSNLDTFWAPNRVAAGTANDWGTGDNWIDVRFDGIRDMSTVAIALLLGGYRVEDVPVRVTAITDNGSLTTDLAPVGTFQQLPVVAGPTQHLRIRIAHESYTSGADVIGIRELLVPGAPIESRLVLPADLIDQFAQPGATTPAWVMSRDHNDGRETDGTIRREFTVPKDAITSVTSYGALSNQSDVVRIVDDTPTMNIGASSTLFDLAEFAPRSLIDGVEASRWLSSRVQTEAIEVATLDLAWKGARTIDGFTVGLSPDLAAPDSVTVTVGDQVRTVPIAADGTVSFEPVVGESMTIVLSFPAIAPDVEPLRIGLASLTVPSLLDLYPGPVDRASRFTVACGSGPRLRVGSAEFDYSIDATLGEVLDRSQLRFVPCGPTSLPLARGSVQLRTASGVLPFAIDRVVIGAPPLLSADVQPGRTLTIDSWKSSKRTVTIAAGEADLLVVNEIFNTGWTATMGGQKLSPLEVDGWRQAFLVPAGAGGEVTLSFAPERSYLLATIAALIVLLGLFLLAVIRGSKRPDLAPLREGTWSKPLVWTFALVATVWTTGIAVVLLPVVWFATRSRRQVLAPIALMGFGIAGATYLATKSFVDTKWFGAKGWTISIFAAVALISVIVAFIVSGEDDSTDGEVANDGV